MKSLLQNEDGPMDRLLRGHLSRQSGPKQDCKQFDPDLANAYIEHSLTATEREGFERHLSLCGDCRTATVVLARLAESEAPASAARHQTTEGWIERLGAFAAALKTPRLAMAAVALLVAAVSIPIILSRVSNRADNDSATAQYAEGDQAGARPAESEKQPESKPAVKEGFVSDSTPGLIAQYRTPRSNPARIASGAESGVGPQQPATADAAQPAAEVPPVPAAKSLGEQNEKREQAAASAEPPVFPSRDQRDRDQRDQVAPGSQQAPSQQQTGGDQLAKVSPEATRSSTEAAKDSAHVSVLKSGRPDGEERAAAGDTKIRPEDNNAPPSPIAGSEPGTRKALSQPSASSLRDGKLNVASRSRGTAERKIGKKRFWLRDEVWTDNDYKPEKEMPMITLVRDSDVFKEVIGKRPTLKGYLTSFTENERAIVVYKGTIYKLIPQDGNK